MKITVILFFGIFTLMSCKAFDKGENSNTSKTDSLFLVHFEVLDSIASNDFIDSTLICIESIQFMEFNTGISSSTDGNYFGKTSFTKNDLKAWHDWYIRNKEKLFWDEKETKVKFK